MVDRGWLNINYLGEESEEERKLIFLVKIFVSQRLSQ
jgi:hypothetical protein